MDREADACRWWRYHPRPDERDGRVATSGMDGLTKVKAEEERDDIYCSFSSVLASAAESDPSGKTY